MVPLLEPSFLLRRPPGCLREVTLSSLPWFEIRCDDGRVL